MLAESVKLSWFSILIERFDEIDPEVTGKGATLDCRELESVESVELTGKLLCCVIDPDSPNMDSPVALDSFKEMAEVKKISRTNNIRNDGYISHVTLYLN